MKRSFVNEISALVIALLSVASPGSAELPSDYRNWPFKQELNEHTTYKKSLRLDSPVVREFPSTYMAGGREIKFLIIGYNPGSSLPPERKPLEISINVDRSTYPINESTSYRIESMSKQSCGKCHPVTNTGRYQS